ncbi:LOW QUALITY PROTEIN: intron Large complex component GCFC2-like [Pelodytes ibericus]
MFRKPKRSLRVRKAESSEEEEEKDTGYIDSNRHKRTQGRGLTCRSREKDGVSATWPSGRDDDDEEEDEDQDEASVQQRGDVDDDETDPPVETGSQHRTGGPHSLLSFNEDKEGEEVSFKVRKPSVNAVVFKVKKKTDGDNADNTKKQEENDFKLESNQSSESECEELSDSPPLEMNSSESAVSSPSPPPRDMEPAAQVISQMLSALGKLAQRRRARTQGDYLSLDAAQEGSSSSQSQSDDELDDHERRIQFAPGTKTLKDQMEEEMSSSSDSGGGDNQEDEDFQDQWEEQQIRKAIKYPQVVDEDLSPRRPPRRVHRKPEPRFSLPMVTIEQVKKKLATRIESLQEVHRSHIQESERYTQDRESSEHSLEMLKKTASEQSFTFFKEMKTYVENFVDCLNEKIIQINDLEAEMFTLIQCRARTLLQRRQDDLWRESAAIPKLAGSEKTDKKSIVDTTLSLLESSDARRSRRRQRRELSGVRDHCEGMSSDDEMQPEEEKAFQESRDRISLQCKDIFEDVLEDFHRIKDILSKFHKWRGTFSESYYDAYISLCIPKLLNPLIRLQLVNWNPLEEITDLEQQDWYCDIEEFSYSSADPETNTEDNPDHNVLSAVIEKSILPKVSEFVDHVWDPLSSRQTNNLVNFCKSYVLGSESKKAVQCLVNSLVSRLKKAIEDDVFIPIYPKSVLEDKTSPHSKFQERQFWSAVKILHNVLCWDGFLQEETLQELALDKLLNRYLLLILLNAVPDSDTVNKCRKIVDCLPQSWFRGLDSGTTLPRLANFSKHLLQCAHTLQKLNDRESLEVLVSLMKKIRALDCVEAISSKYNMNDLQKLEESEKVDKEVQELWVIVRADNFTDSEQRWAVNENFTNKEAQLHNIIREFFETYEEVLDALIQLQDNNFIDNRDRLQVAAKRALLTNKMVDTMFPELLRGSLTSLGRTQGEGPRDCGPGVWDTGECEQDRGIVVLVSRTPENVNRTLGLWSRCLGHRRM